MHKFQAIVNRNKKCQQKEYRGSKRGRSKGKHSEKYIDSKRLIEVKE